MSQTPQNPDLTRPIATEATAEQPPFTSDAVPPVREAAPSPVWAEAAHEGERPASTPAAPLDTKDSWRSKVTGGRGLAAGALVVGLGLGAVGGSVATWAVTHDDAPSVGTTADGRPGFDPDGDGGFGPPGGGRGGMPPGGRQQDGGTTGRLPGGGADTGNGTDGSTEGSSGSGTDANGTSQAT